MVKKSYKFRFYPTRQQQKQLAIEFGQARFVWNWALDMRSKAYKRRTESLNAVSISRVLTRLKRSTRYAWLYDACATCHTQKLHDLDIAFKNFFAKRARYPRFKSRHRGVESIRYQLDQRNIHRDYGAGKTLRIPKLGELKIKWSQTPQGIPKMATLSRDPVGRYFVSLSVEEGIQPRARTECSVGIDLGLHDVVVTSEGWKSGAPKYYRKYERALARAQRVLSRRKKGSGRRLQQRIRVARIHLKVKDSRRDFLHKLSSKLINENQVIGIEDLCVKGMHRGWLSKSISDTGLGEFRRQLEYKAVWYGRQLQVIDRFEPTSKTCSGCGHKLDELDLSVREWICPKCRMNHDRDINAAKNVLNTVRRTGIPTRGESGLGGGFEYQALAGARGTVNLPD